MADKKISALTSASTPLAGTEVLPIVQSGATVKVAVSDLTAGRDIAATSITTTARSSFNGGGIYIGNTSSFGTASAAVSIYNGGSSTNYFKGDATYWQNAAGTQIMDLNSAGNFTIAGATATKASGLTWANPSDQRLKDNIRDYPKGTTELMQVRVREWDYNGKGGTTLGMKGLGVVADEVMTVLPDTVENYYAKLNAEDQETVAIKKFDATEITWLLVKTIQEQQALIESLNSRILALENK